jgi:uncharacterized protein involved in outer membrane biogenesis
VEKHGRRLLVGLAAVVTLVLLVGVVASYALDSYVQRHQRELLAKLEAKLGRKVDVGRLSASLWSGLTATQVQIGGSRLPGDQAPLLSAERLRVKPSLLRTLLSFGRRVRIADIELTSPVLTVVRLPDGSLNVDHLGGTGNKAPPQPMAPKTRDLVDNAQLRRAHISDGRVRFVDGKSTVEISRIDLTVKDVGLRSRPSVELHAAVISPQPNLELRAQLGRSGDLQHLPPPVESAHLKLSPTELAPLLPFLPQLAAGLQAGTASVDLDVKWSDVAKLKGNARLLRAHFADGAPFDAKLDVDAEGNPRDGDADVHRLEAVAGDMTLLAHGKLQSLTREPRFDDFSVESRNLDFDRMRQLDPHLDQHLGMVAHGPIQIVAKASGQSLTASVDLTGASLSAPGSFVKARGVPWRIELVGRAQKQQLQVDSKIQVARQLLSAKATVRFGDNHPLVDAHATTEGLSLAALAPLVPSLARQGLPPMVVSADAHLSGRAGQPETFAVEVEGLHVTSRNTDVVASLKALNFEKPQIDVNLRSGYLDTADLLPGSSTPQPGGSTPQPGSSTPQKSSSRPSPALAHLGGHVVVSVEKGVVSGVAFDGLRGDFTIKDGAVHANKLDIGAWGGRFAGDGSDFDVARGPFHLVGHAANVDAEQLLARLGAARKILRGRLSAQLDVRGHGTTPAELENSLAGTLDGSAEEAQLLAFNFDELLAGQLVHALPFKLPTGRVSDTTHLGTLRGQLRFADGAVILTRPLSANTPEGPLELAGRFFFDGRLDLTGTLQLQPEAASALFAGRIHPSEPLPLSLKLGGTIHAPALGIPNLVDVGKVLAKAAIGGLIPGRQQAKVPSGNQAIDQLKGLFRR